MYSMLDAHFLSVVIIVGSIMVTPIYVMATYVFSGASAMKGFQIGCAFLIWGAIMFWVCLSQLPRNLGTPGNLIVPVSWILPGLILYWQRNWFLSQELSQKWLIGIQIFRVIGGVFLIEMVKGHIPGIFAYPAGIGDILVAVAAFAVLVACRKHELISGKYVIFIVVIGMADFLSAFFFGFFSSATPLQIFFPAKPNQNILFPTGMIPLFLVPYVIFFHVLSLINYQMFQRSTAKEKS